MALDFFGFLSRSGAIVVALILISGSATTLKVINDNEPLVELRDHNSAGLSRESKALQGLIVLTQSAAWWCIILSIGTTVVQAISIMVLIVNKHSTIKIVLGVLEIIGSCLAILCFLATGIACAAYAANWGEPPESCQIADDFSGADKEDICDSVPLTTTNSLQAVLSFVEIGVFGAIILATIFNMQSRPTTSNGSLPQKI